jgi:signal-transduction protein with cAMP-binding, CBS, and nucleotidyltransferase domain
MREPRQILEPDDWAFAACRQMRLHRLRHRVVVRNGNVVGLLSFEEGLLTRCEHKRVSEVMSKRRGPRLIRMRMPRYAL